MNNYLIVAQITRILVDNRTKRDSVIKYLSNKCIEAKSKKEAFDKYNEFTLEQNVVTEKITTNVEATILNIIEL